MITNFKIFEASIEDILILKGDNKGIFKDYLNREYEDDVTLIKVVHIKEYNKDIKIRWFNTKKHDFIQKIQDRTSFKKTSEFNDYFSNALNILFGEKFNELENKTKFKDSLTTFCLFSKEYRFYLPIEFTYNNLFTDDASMYVKSISITTCNKSSKFYINIH